LKNFYIYSYAMSSTGTDFEPVKKVISESINVPDITDITDITEVKQTVESMTSKVGDVDFSEMTIHQASRQGFLHIVKNIIESGYAKATDRDTENVTPLHFAVINNHVTVAKYLIDNGAEIDAFGGDLIATPLHWASSLRDSQGFDCLHLAVHSSNPMLVLYFICLDMAIDTQDSSQHTPLMWAAYQCDSLIVDILIRLGASLSKVNNTQLTPLHFAAMKSDKMCLRKLIEAGANINAKDENGKTPFDIVKEVKAIDKWKKAMKETGLENNVDTAHQQECGGKCKTAHKHNHFSKISKVFEGHDDIVNPFDFGCWYNCINFWSEGKSGMLQNVDWYEIFDTSFIDSRDDMKSNGYTVLKRDEEI
ncbi:2845_t:CDS:2, partial [Racocetra fulgida]